jgi:hypothetical protein
MADQRPIEPGISEGDWKLLTELFIKFEGASDPLSRETKEAKATFFSLVSALYETHVPVSYRTQVTSTSFTRYIRVVCRSRTGTAPSSF